MYNYSDLTPKQQKVLHYYVEQIRHYRKTPSLRTAAKDNEVSHMSIAQILDQLEKKKYIGREGKYSRTIKLARKAKAFPGCDIRRVPVIGSIAAGLPLYAQEEWDGTVVVDVKKYRSEILFGLRIQGDSMKDAGIIEDDIVICEPRQFAKNGEIVAALIHQEEATVKRFFLKRKRVELKPENEAYTSKFYDFDDILIQGKVVGLIRESIV